MEIVLIGIICFLLGVQTAVLVIDFKIVRPLKELLSKSHAGWKQSIDLLQQVTGIQPDGSVKSPIQIHNHE